MNKLNKTNGIFLISEGILIIGFWIKIFITEGIENLVDNQVLSAIFHLTSESMLSIFCILTGLGLLKKVDWSKKLIFFTFGFFSCSVINAGSLYMFDKEYFDFLMVLMFTVFLVIALYLFFISRVKYNILSSDKKLELNYNDELFIRGFLLYALINLAGYHGQIQGSHWGIFIIIITCLVVIGYSTIKKLDLRN